nr:MAG TPA: hypothetical protein [Caudoviricetes sp.]
MRNLKFCILSPRPRGVCLKHIPICFKYAYFWLSYAVCDFFADLSNCFKTHSN